MRERLLLLAMAYPEKSEKYGHTVCLAGINDEGELRRAYPVPYHIWRDNQFHKRMYIDYEIRGKGDYRKESMKINYETISFLDEEARYDQIRNICQENVKTFEELWEDWKKDRTSLGIIKPNLTGFKMDNKEIIHDPTTMLFPGYKAPEQLEHRIRYKFQCNLDNCRGHFCSTVDTEAGQLYRNLKKDNSIEETESKMRSKLFDWMNTRDLYFMVGTIFQHPNHWTIISLLYPEKIQEHTLSEYQTPTYKYK